MDSRGFAASVVAVAAPAQHGTARNIYSVVRQNTPCVCTRKRRANARQSPAPFHVTCSHATRARGGRLHMLLLVVGLLHQVPQDGPGLVVVAPSEEVVVVQVVVEEVDLLALLEAGVLRDQVAVGGPKVAVEAGTPRHPPLGLVVAVVAGGIEDAWLAVHPAHVSAPEIPVQDARFDGDPFEVVSQVVAELLAQLAELGVAREPDLVHDALVAKELHPVPGPLVGLRGAPDGVVDVEAEEPVLRLLHRGLREVHLRHLGAQLGLAVPPADVQVLHHEEGAHLAVRAVVQHVRHADRVRVVHGLEALCLAGEHLFRTTVAADLDKEFFAVRELQPLEGSPRRGPHATRFHHLTPKIALHPFVNLIVAPAADGGGSSPSRFHADVTIPPFPRCRGDGVERPSCGKSARESFTAGLPSWRA
mmetsp:Transcript_31484/g.68828  ORF Transcript_31484/g.68828 Transcript_31484/m.68828 type:complete len:418 (-) Transcript_31484:35-1288(-)|eukprot:CAMPEP_0118953156 /NCGR_PEP_ID=MMETSP1169-20130426/56057_1 /TAXON_ID=36882 /ORGANISM="Pyramimonas obovata, Strain CCMP722" /LENGTH=417 /DNA_ID=CAMNT_0006900545 /DNA_START=48 /DNA_END=1301 /DNA_ORIENTATION=+